VKLVAGEVAVVTGAASGIGLALTVALGEAGLRVVMADVEAPALDAAADDLRARGHEVLTAVTDVSHYPELESLRDRTLATFGRVDMIVNNAGVVGPWGPCWELDERDWTWTLGVNLWGVVHGIRAFVPALVERRHGHVVNIASMGGLLALPGNAPYAASKHAVVAITESLAAELTAQETGVGATIVCPGQIPTRIRDSARNRPAHLTAVAPLSSWAPGQAPYSVSATDAARAALAGVELDQLLVLPSPGTGPSVIARAERLVAAQRRGGI
jgi:NAD(P)-dependent dehydrogenase (short-subunit alcohol dehydrogenase family)